MSKNVVATIREDAPFVPAGRYYLFSEPAAWTLMPTDEGSGQLPLTLDKGAYTLTADAAPTDPDEMQGMLRVYKLRPIALTLTDSSGNHAALSVSYGADNLAVLQSWGFDCRSAGEPTDKPAETFTVAVKNGGGLLPKGKLEVWRDGDALRFFRRDKGLYTGKGSLQSGELPVRSIRSVKAAGEVRREAYQVHGTEGGLMTGRAIAIGSALALVFGLFGTLLLNIIGLVIGIVIGIIVGIQTSLQEGEPDRTEYREVDERSTAVEIDAPTGGAATLFFEPQAMESFAKLLTFEEMRGEARKTAPKADMIDQLERLAGLHEKGHLTDEEFEQAKARLLGKI